MSPSRRSTKRIPRRRAGDSPPYLIYHMFSSGNTLPNFTLKRGSAIIGATVSRQTG